MAQTTLRVMASIGSATVSSVSEVSGFADRFHVGGAYLDNLFPVWASFLGSIILFYVIIDDVCSLSAHYSSVPSGKDKEPHPAMFGNLGGPEAAVCAIDVIIAYYTQRTNHLCVMMASACVAYVLWMYISRKQWSSRGLASFIDCKTPGTDYKPGNPDPYVTREYLLNTALGICLLMRFSEGNVPVVIFLIVFLFTTWSNGYWRIIVFGLLTGNLPVPVIGYQTPIPIPVSHGSKPRRFQCQSGKTGGAELPGKLM